MGSETQTTYVAIASLFLVYLLPIISGMVNIYLKFKIWLYGKTTTGDVIKTWCVISSSPRGTNRVYYMQFSFIHDVTHSYLHALVHKYCIVKFDIDHEREIFPQELINICIEYIGYESITFWYGPYVLKQSYNQSIYQTVGEKKVNVMYDATNPYNATIPDMKGKDLRTILMTCLVIIVFIASYTFLYLYFRIQILVILGVMVSLLVFIPAIAIQCKQTRLCCCCKQRHGLQIECQI